MIDGCTFVALDSAGTGRFAAMAAAFALTFVVRSLAIKYGWSLPACRESARRERWKT